MCHGTGRDTEDGEHHGIARCGALASDYCVAACAAGSVCGAITTMDEEGCESSDVCGIPHWRSWAWDRAPEAGCCTSHGGGAYGLSNR